MYRPFFCCRYLVSVIDTVCRSVVANCLVPCHAPPCTMFHWCTYACAALKLEQVCKSSILHN